MCGWTTACNLQEKQLYFNYHGYGNVISGSYIALRRVDTETVLDALLYFFGRFGLPKEILSDHGRNFTSTLMKEAAKRLGIG